MTWKRMVGQPITSTSIPILAGVFAVQEACEKMRDKKRKRDEDEEVKLDDSAVHGDRLEAGH